MSKPIRPDDVALAKRTVIPPVVFEVVNELIVENFFVTGATVAQKDIVARITERAPDVARLLFQRGWLNIEDAYRAEGWTVNYDKPGYNESYEATFSFVRRKP